MGEAQASPGRACPERIKATVQPTAASGFQQQGVRFPAGKGQEEGGIRMAKRARVGPLAALPGQR